MTELEERRDHLLASLEDLDAEYEAGDIDEVDYRALRDDYTARAAAAIRALDGDEAAETAGDVDEAAPSRSWARIGLWVVGVLAFSVVAGVLIGQASGSRGRSGVGSGEIRQSSRVLLFEGGEAAAAGDLDGAIERYDQVIDIEPANVEAFTYRGWTRWQRGDGEAAADDLAEAVALDATYPDARVFSAVLAVNGGDVDEAAAHLVAFTETEPPALMRDLVAEARLRERTAELFGEQGRVADALAFLDALIETDPADPAPAAYRGWILARSSIDAPELAVGAEERLVAVVEMDPTYPDAYVYLAFLFNSLDRQDEARAQLASYDDLVGDEAPPHLAELIELQGLRQALT